MPTAVSTGVLGELLAPFKDCAPPSQFRLALADEVIEFGATEGKSAPPILAK
jgi:hypothetical protein